MFKNLSRFEKACAFTFLVVVIMTPGLFSQSEMDNVVPIETARKMAENEISTTKLLEEWHSAAISSENPLIFFDLNHHPIAYMFKVIKDGGYIGYITISASFDFYPIREYSPAAFPIENLEKCREQASSLVGPLSQEYELIYLGGMLYLVRFISLSGDDVVVGLSPFGMVIPEENLKKAQLFLEEKANEIKGKAKLIWERMYQ